MAVIAASMLVMGAAGEGIILTLALAFAGLFLWSSQDIVNAAAMDAAPDGLQGSTVALMFLSSLLGATVGVIVLGFVVELTESLRSIFWLAGAVAAPGAIIFLFAPLKRES